MAIKKITKEKIKQQEWGNLTVGELKKFIEKHNVGDDVIIMIERVHDVYYEKHGWDVYLKPPWFFREEEVKDKTDEERDGYMNQYHPAFGCTQYKDDEEDFLFIDLHY
jgi:hypothetical protein